MKLPLPSGNAIFPAPKGVKLESGAYFLPYQVAWILDDSPLMLGEKSVRIGWTFADAYRNVRRRLEFKKRDYLFTTKDQSTAFEYIQTCQEHAEKFNYTKSILSHGVETIKVPKFELDGTQVKGFDEEVKVGVIKFDTGSRIIAFSSNPNALRAYGGDVGMDELTFHPSPQELWAAASGRATWGYDLAAWSSHNGDATLFKAFADEARMEDSPWSYYKVTMPDAIALGLVDKINALSGKRMSPEEFWESCLDKARFREVLDQEYLCIPRGGSASIVDWGVIAKCSLDYEIERVHMEHDQIISQFGEYSQHRADERSSSIRAWLKQVFKTVLNSPKKYRMGFDVAASGKGDLCCFYIDELDGSLFKLAALLTCRTEDWEFIKTCGRVFCRGLSSLKAAGDETGLGKQICWELSKEFPGIFTGVNFSSSKSDMGFGLMNQLTAGQKLFPKNERDIPADYYALQKRYQGKRWVFTEGSNAHNPNSHCDISWAGALSSYADQGKQEGFYFPS